MADVTLVLKADNSQYVNKMKEAQQASQKVYDTVEKGSKKEKGLIEDIEQTLTRLQEKRKKAFTIEDIEKYNKKIQEAKKDLEEYEKAGLGVQKQTESLSQTITKWALSLGGAAAALKVLKDAVLLTTAGINAFNVAGAVAKQVMYNLVTGAQSLGAGLKGVIEAQKQLNELRLKEVVDTFKAKEQQVLYNKYYFEASDRRKTDEERIKSLDKALEAHNKMLDIETENIKEQLAATKALIEQAPGNEKLLIQFGNLNNKLLDLESERYSGVKRLEGQRTAMLQEEITKREDQYQKYLDEIDKMNEESDKKETERKKERYELWKDYYDWYRDEVDKSIKDENKKKEEDWQNELNWAKKLFEQNKRDAKEEWDRLQAKSDAEKKKQLEDEDFKRNLAEETYRLTVELENSIFDFKSQQIDNALNKEINALDIKTKWQLAKAGDDESEKQKILDRSEAKKLEIERKYKRQQQKLDVQQAIANGVLAVIKTFSQFGWPWGIIPASLMTAIVATQVATIKSQTFAKGGWTGLGDRRDHTGERVAGVVHGEEFVIKKGPAMKFREVLEAINKGDQRMVLNKFNKLSPELLGGTTVNNVVVENEGPNKRLDKVNEQLKQLNRRQSSEEVFELNGMTIIKKGSTTRIVRR